MMKIALNTGVLLLASTSLVSAKGFWSSTPAEYSDVIRQAYPVGNGKLGAMPFGEAGAETVNLNVDSLWSGGPFQSSDYTGGNPAEEVFSFLPGIREFIFSNGTGNVTQLLSTKDEDTYGSYQVLGNLTVAIAGIESPSAYNRSLDFSDGIHTTTFKSGASTFTSTVYCAYPDQVCVYSLTSSNTLPEVTIGIENQMVDDSIQNVTCGDGFVRLTGVTQAGPPLGMKYDSIARLSAGIKGSRCNEAGLLVVPSSGIRTLSIVIGAGTNYDQTHGNPAFDFSFQGVDPGPEVESVTSAAAAKAESSIRSAHIADYQSLANLFVLDLPDTAQSAGLETSAILDRYAADGPGDPFIEATLFAYGRHLFISSTRDNSMPPSLQGRWAVTLENAWGSDYHSNINFQMNHFGVDETGLGALQAATWNYIMNTWVPRGQLTAQLLYGTSASSGAWVTHDEMNIFGHTAMKDTAQWANYPASAAWMMQIAFDYWDYYRDVAWLKAQGYPLMKGVAQFWLSQLQEDKFFNDGTLVVNNCNSPEQGPTTFACTHYQQLIHQLFTTTLVVASPAGETDSQFLRALSTSLTTLDKGLHIGTWGEVKEWKIPDSFGYDFENNTHRHLSNLYGWFPGWSVSSYLGGVSNATIQEAVRTTLYSRGLGDGPDADAGWEKVWRGACWARLQQADMAYTELIFAIGSNFAANGFSMYSGEFTPFQIDANFGLVGNVLAMLVTDLPQAPTDASTQTITLGPAIPVGWPTGSVKGLRIRGGGTVDFSWEGSVVNKATVTGRQTGLVVLDSNRKVLARV